MTGPRRFPAWWNKIEPTRDAPPPSAQFDAIISVGPYNLPPGIRPDLAVAAIRRPIKALPGAAWIVVDHHPIGSAEGAVQVLPVDNGVSAPADLQGQVVQPIAAAIRDLPCPSPVPPSHCEPSSPTHDAILFPEIESGMAPAGWSDSQTFTSITLRDLATASTTGTVPDGGVAGAPGLQAVTDAELLAQVLTCVGITGAAEFAHRIVARFGSFGAVLSASELELRKIPGLGTHSIAAVKLVHALALRLSQAAIKDTPLLDRSDLLMRYLAAVLARERIEHCRILFLDADGRLRADEAQARGTVNHTPVYPREVIGRALELKAAAIILVHTIPAAIHRRPRTTSR